MVNRDMETGCHDNPENRSEYFTTAYFHRPDEIREELGEAGFGEVNLVAVEGFATPLPQVELLADPILGARLLKCLDSTESVPELLGVSSHILAIAKRSDLTN